MMKKILLSFVLFLFCIEFISAQELGTKDICQANKKEAYFPLKEGTKKIIWGRSYYVEQKVGSTEIDGKTYFVYEQHWEDGRMSTLFLRFENGATYEYQHANQTELVRYQPDYKVGHKWTSKDGKTVYQIESVKGKLKTPHCSYKNLLVIKAKKRYGTYTFYYCRGIGYIGATDENGELYSYLTFPE